MLASVPPTVTALAVLRMLPSVELPSFCRPSSILAEIVSDARMPMILPFSSTTSRELSTLVMLP